MKRIYVSPLIRKITLAYRHTVLRINPGSITVNRFEEGEEMTVGGDVEEEPTGGRRTLWDLEPEN